MMMINSRIFLLNLTILGLCPLMLLRPSIVTATNFEDLYSAQKAIAELVEPCSLGGHFDCTKVCGNAGRDIMQTEDPTLRRQAYETCKAEYVKVFDRLPTAVEADLQSEQVSNQQTAQPSSTIEPKESAVDSRDAAVDRAIHGFFDAFVYKDLEDLEDGLKYNVDQVATNGMLKALVDELGLSGGPLGIVEIGKIAKVIIERDALILGVESIDQISAAMMNGDYVPTLNDMKLASEGFGMAPADHPILIAGIDDLKKMGVKPPYDSMLSVEHERYRRQSWVERYGAIGSEEFAYRFGRRTISFEPSIAGNQKDLPDLTSARAYLAKNARLSGAFEEALNRIVTTVSPLHYYGMDGYGVAETSYKAAFHTGVDYELVRLTFFEKFKPAAIQQAHFPNIVGQQAAAGRGAALKRLADAEVASDIFSVAHNDISSRLRLFYNGDFEALLIAGKRDVERFADQSGLTLLSGVAPKLGEVVDHAMEVNRYQGLLAQYALVKLDAVGTCGEKTKDIKVTETLVERWVNGFGVTVSEDTEELSNYIMAVPEQFVPYVLDANDASASRLYAPGLRQIIEQSGGCESPVLQQLEENMLAFQSYDSVIRNLDDADALRKAADPYH